MPESPPLQSATPRMCLVLHDVAPATWSRCQAIIDSLGEVSDAPWTFLAVPNYHRRGRLETNSEFRAAVDGLIGQGCEIAQHGYFHLDPRATKGVTQHLRRRVYTAGEGEFSALDYAAAQRRINAGRAALARCGWQAQGFVPPAWLASAEARRAIDDAGFAYCSTLTEITRLPDGLRLAGRSFCYSARSALRRKISRVFNSRLLRALRDEPVVRVALHPADAEHPELMRHARWLVERLDAQRLGVTKQALLTDL